jgi:hypothetical protein
MKTNKRDGLEGVEQFFEFARRREGKAQLKPLNYTFEPARRPDMMMPQRPRTDISAADVAVREIREYASKARELYQERRKNERPLDAREYVRHQLALGMLDAPARRLLKNETARTDTVIADEKPSRQTRKGFGFWRRKPAE